MPQGGPRKAAYNSIMRKNTRALTTILTSAYLSAMLTSSVSPIRNSSIFAAAVDPTAPQQAFKNAVSGLDAAGWAAAVAGAPVPVPPAPKNMPAAPSQTDPVMNEDFMARLIAFTLAKGASTFLDQRVSKIFGINDGAAHAPIKQVAEPLPEGKHYLLLVDGSKDVVIAFRRADTGRVSFYLTDKTGVLRAAAIMHNGVWLITNEQAAEDYKNELKLFARLAKDLPPTGAAVAGNS